MDTTEFHQGNLNVVVSNTSIEYLQSLREKADENQTWAYEPVALLNSSIINTSSFIYAGNTGLHIHNAPSSGKYFFHFTPNGIWHPTQERSPLNATLCIGGLISLADWNYKTDAGIQKIHGSTNYAMDNLLSEGIFKGTDVYQSNVDPDAESAEYQYEFVIDFDKWSQLLLDEDPATENVKKIYNYRFKRLLDEKNLYMVSPFLHTSANFGGLDLYN
jgi:hypothetical protein